MKLEFGKRGINFECQKKIKVCYRDGIAGYYFADLLLGGLLLRLGLRKNFVELMKLN